MQDQLPNIWNLCAPLLTHSFDLQTPTPSAGHLSVDRGSSGLSRERKRSGSRKSSKSRGQTTAAQAQQVLESRWLASQKEVINGKLVAAQRERKQRKYDEKAAALQLERTVSEQFWHWYISRLWTHREWYLLWESKIYENGVSQNFFKCALLVSVGVYLSIPI